MIRIRIEFKTTSWQDGGVEEDKFQPVDAKSRLEYLKCFQDESLLVRDRAMFVPLLICRWRNETTGGNGESVLGVELKLGILRYGTNNTCRHRFHFLSLSLFLCCT